jgi:hypothetical protein
MPKIDQLLPVVAIGGVLWFLSRRTDIRNLFGPGPGDAPDYVPVPLDPGAGAGGRSLPGGSLSDIGLMSAPGELGLHAHALERENGQRVEINVAWTNSTTDFQGNFIPWPARLAVELGHTAGVFRWANMGELLGSGGRGTDENLRALPGSHNSVVVVTMGGEPNPPQLWDARVTLEMQGSTDSGAPDGKWSEVAQDTHENAVQSIASVGRTTAGGSLGAIGVTPWAATGAGALDPWRHVDVPVMNTTAARSQMRRLGMSQERSPWGQIGQPEVRSWPISNRNPNLPGVHVTVRQGRGMGGSGSAIGPGHRLYAV